MLRLCALILLQPADDSRWVRFKAARREPSGVCPLNLTEWGSTATEACGPSLMDRMEDASETRLTGAAPSLHASLKGKLKPRIDANERE
jgi:hypothetical protein